MKTATALISTLLALATVGCAPSPAGVVPMPAIAPEAAPASEFEVLQAAPTPSGTVASASSTQSAALFPASNVTDGVLTSAWRPAGTDALPFLQFDLPAATQLSAIAVKLSLSRDASIFDNRVYVGVQTSNDGATWNTVAVGLRPAETELATLDLPDTSALYVRVNFIASDTNTIANLTVCEVQIIEGAAPGGGDAGGDTGAPGGDAANPGDPSPSPSPSPSASPGNGNGNGNGGGGNGNRGVGQGGGGGNGTPNEGNGGGNGNP